MGDQERSAGTGGALTPVGVGGSAREAWLEALASDSGALVSQTPDWLDCICDCGRFEDVTRAYRRADGSAVVLPLARLRGLPAIAAIEGSMPFGWSTGGLVCTDGRLHPEDVRLVLEDLVRRRPLRATIAPSGLANGAWSAGAPPCFARTTRLTQSVDLSAGFDDVWKRFRRSVRSWCRKAARDLTVDSDDTGRLVPVFDSLYRQSVVRWAEQQHEPLPLARWRAARRDPSRKFATVADRLGPACRVWVAWRAGEAAAAVVVLTHGEHALYWRGAMDKELAVGAGANELLHRLAIEDACTSGRRFYHMGESAPGSGLAHFKRGFGAREEPASVYRYERVPLTATDQFVRRQVKRALRFRD
jgi:hypothetical protein